MSDNQRRIFCQVLFLLLCILPTAVTGYWICHPQTASGWELTLRAKLGVETSIDSIETPGPYVTILRGLEFTDPVIGTLFKAVEARIEFGTESNIISIPYRAQGLTNKGLASLVQTVNQKLIRSHGVDKPWQIRFEKDTIVSQASFGFDPNSPSDIAYFRQLPMSSLQLDIFPLVDGTHCTASFSVPSSDTPQTRINCSLSRSPEYDQLLVLDTNDVPLPCWLVADSVPNIAMTLGSESRFRGRMELVPALGDSQVAIDGIFENVDLEATLAIPSTEERYATIELEDCFFENGAFSRWEASIAQGSSPKVRIGENRLFTFTRQFAPGEAIKEAMMKRWANRIVDQPYR